MSADTGVIGWSIAVPEGFRLEVAGGSCGLNQKSRTFFGFLLGVLEIFQGSIKSGVRRGGYAFRGWNVGGRDDDVSLHY
jgi:hypothetical protein